ncbi:DUF2694 family protein [Mycobacterium marinum]|uniref:ESX-1 secretion-associated protein EspD n=1 Tax=Mycobacterium marinum TaxID=1781 RepID=A0A3E2N154_MYCMR|nr:DUF2694 family protein [Mycobacterium marinum]RFZ46530.1 ESX-1 secretion-associated protein EspD [Mycobacterium marinum]GJO37967.1 ESX-1 secretion-associated protein EspH [Mycobacterium marinum]
MVQPGSHSPSNLDALNFSRTAESTQSAIDALRAFAPTPPEEPDVDMKTLHKPAEQKQQEEEQRDLYTVTNPQGTVSVSAVLGGSIHRVELSEEVTTMAEPNLAEEIFVIADLARQKARAAQHTLMVEGMNDVVGDEHGAKLREFLGTMLNLPTPQEAAAAEKEVFATRYGGESARNSRGNGLDGVPVFAKRASDEHREADW